MPYDTGRRDKEEILKVKKGDLKETVIQLVTLSFEEGFIAHINIERHDDPDPQYILGLKCKLITIPIRRVFLRSFLKEGIT
jgi:hypothetical protein